MFKESNTMIFGVLNMYLINVTLLHINTCEGSICCSIKTWQYGKEHGLGFHDSDLVVDIEL